MSDSQPSLQRQRIIDVLSGLETQTKARQNFIRGCSKREGLSTESSRSLEIFSWFEAEHAKRLRRLKQIWMTLGTPSRLPEGLVSVSEMLLRESDTLNTALEPLRRLSITEERSAFSETWTLLWKSAASFIEGYRTSAGTSNSGSGS